MATTPVDVHVGQRIRLRRNIVRMSQEKLAEGVGVTFQQVQKYENGTNRTSASRLAQFATILGVPVAYFFEDAPGDPNQTGERQGVVTDPLMEALQDRTTATLVVAFGKLGASHRAAVLRLVRVMAGEVGVDAAETA